MRYRFPYVGAANTARPRIRDHAMCLFRWVLTAPTQGRMAQAELTWVPGSALRWFTRPKTVTHPGTNRAQRRVTTVIEANALPLSIWTSIKGLCMYVIEWTLRASSDLLISAPSRRVRRSALHVSAPRSLPASTLTLYGHINTAQQWTIIQRYGDWYTGHWLVGCYIWYSEEEPARAGAPPSPLLAVPNVTAHPSTASVPTSYYLTWH